MAINYVKLAATALKLINANGRSVSLSVSSRTPTDPTMPWRGTDGTATTITVKAVIYPFDFAEVASGGSKEAYSRDLIHDNVRRGDMQAIVAASAIVGIDPLKADYMLDGTITWHVINVAAIQPGDTAVAYTFHLRE